MGHTFYIPVMGTSFTIDTPIKVAHMGISSVVSIGDDALIERMRKYYMQKNDWNYDPISEKEEGFRSKRITAYLNMMQKIVEEKVSQLKNDLLEKKGELCKYFELLPETSTLKKIYNIYLTETNPDQKSAIELELKQKMTAGAIDVNIMSKVDKANYSMDGDFLNSDAQESLKGFAESNLSSSVVLSAGLNPKLYSYIETFIDFFPIDNQPFKKKIILKVSDYRSALIQAKFFAKKGIWVSEFRIESGLNCGGHAFATDGILTGPILEEFRLNRQAMCNELFETYQKALTEKGINCIKQPEQLISYQGGIGTENEDRFIREYFQLNGTGWGSPFLLAPDVTTIDEQTLNDVATASQDDFYISGASPLGVPFNNFKKSSSEKQRLERIAKGRPGSPCLKKLLVSNTEFTKEPICTASRQYQDLKIKQLNEQNLDKAQYDKAFDVITEKACLCDGLAASAYIEYDILKPRERRAVAICPGPNIAYFSKITSLDEMVKHIYGKTNLLAGVKRSNVFINELRLYLSFVKKEISMNLSSLSDKKAQYFQKFKTQLNQSIQYYKDMVPNFTNQSVAYRNDMLNELNQAEHDVTHIFAQLEQSHTNPTILSQS